MVFTGAVALTDVSTLARRLVDVDPPSLLDVRWRLGGPPGWQSYLDGHIPGAAFVDLDAQLAGEPGPSGRHPLPDPERLQQALRLAGVRHSRSVVVYDSGDGAAAARLWWTLRWAGHTDVSVLNGGFAAWVAQDRPVEPGKALDRSGDFTVRPGQLPVLDADAASELARTGVLLDARTAPRYRGEHEPIDPVAGHIPGAVNVPMALLTHDDGRLRSAPELRQIFAAAGVGTGAVGAYCGSGVTAAHTILALHQAGHTEAALYVGSWSNWIADPSRPRGGVDAGNGHQPSSAGDER